MPPPVCASCYVARSRSGLERFARGFFFNAAYICKYAFVIFGTAVNSPHFALCNAVIPSLDRRHPWLLTLLLTLNANTLAREFHLHRASSFFSPPFPLTVVFRFFFRICRAEELMLVRPPGSRVNLREMIRAGYLQDASLQSKGGECARSVLFLALYWMYLFAVNPTPLFIMAICAYPPPRPRPPLSFLYVFTPHSENSITQPRMQMHSIQFRRAAATRGEEEGGRGGGGAEGGQVCRNKR